MPRHKLTILSKYIFEKSARLDNNKGVRFGNFYLSKKCKINRGKVQNSLGKKLFMFWNTCWALSCLHVNCAKCCCKGRWSKDTHVITQTSSVTWHLVPGVSYNIWLVCLSIRQKTGWPSDLLNRRQEMVVWGCVCIVLIPVVWIV